MKVLSTNWLTEGLIDFEYKKYILLAYLKEVKSNFEASKLYPFFSDLIFHYQNLQVLKTNKSLLKSAFPERLTNADFENLKLVYEKMSADDELMKEIEDIIQFSLPQFQKYVNEGKSLFDFFEQNLTISTIGIVPIQPDNGYVLLTQEKSKSVKVYAYQVTIFENSTEKYRGIHTQYVEQYRLSYTNTPETIKRDLIRRNKFMPNPATYMVHASMPLPLEETYLPVAKRVLIRYITSQYV